MSKFLLEIVRELEIAHAKVDHSIRRLVAADIIRKFTIAADSWLLEHANLLLWG